MMADLGQLGDEGEGGRSRASGAGEFERTARPVGTDGPRPRLVEIHLAQLDVVLAIDQGADAPEFLLFGMVPAGLGDRFGIVAEEIRAFGGGERVVEQVQMHDAKHSWTEVGSVVEVRGHNRKVARGSDIPADAQPLIPRSAGRGGTEERSRIGSVTNSGAAS